LPAVANGQPPAVPTNGTQPQPADATDPKKKKGLLDKLKNIFK
jgi:hypothetical protein